MSGRSTLFSVSERCLAGRLYSASLSLRYLGGARYLASKDIPRVFTGSWIYWHIESRERDIWPVKTFNVPVSCAFRKASESETLPALLLADSTSDDMTSEDCISDDRCVRVRDMSGASVRFRFRWFKDAVSLASFDPFTWLRNSLLPGPSRGPNMLTPLWEFAILCSMGPTREAFGFVGKQSLQNKKWTIRQALGEKV
jgi:hypothetical protein